MNAQDLENGLHGQVISTTAESDGFQQNVLAMVGSWRYPEPFCFGVRLALKEALDNAIHHGNQDDPTKKVWILFRINPQDVEFVIVDEGPGFDPEDVPDPTLPENIEDPHGRGLLLMGYYMEQFETRGQGNIVRLRRTRAWEPPSVAE